MTFKSLNIRSEIVKSLEEDGLTKPTPIQEKAIPLIMSGKDIIGISKTGSGKTAAFGIPILEKIVPGKGLQAFIMAPTRELACQISQELCKFGKYIRFSIATVYGGVAIQPQMDEIARADIVVGTPGRLLDHLQRNTLNLSLLKCFVLDEADKMVEMGFIEDIRRILDNTPKNKQMLLFGATISEEIKDLKQKYMNHPETARTETDLKEEFLKQYYYNVQPHEKFSLLVHALKKEDTGRVIIFCSTRSTVEILAKNLNFQGINAEMIHGKLNQNRRLRVMNNFNKGNPNILVASAVAARGIDIKDVTHIFNYDLSQDPQEYIHRVGRTARAGALGKAITLLSSRDHEAFNAVLSKHNINVELLPLEEFPRLHFKTGNSQSRFRSNGYGRNSGYSGRSRSNGQRSYGNRRSFGKRNFR